MPTTDTVVIAASGGDYTSLFSAEAAEQGDYVTADKIMEYSHQLAGDTTAVTFSGSTTDATRYIRVFAPSGWRHAGVWDAAKSYIEKNSGAGVPYAVIQINDNFVKLEYLQVKKSLNSNFETGIRALHGTGGVVTIESCIVRGLGTETAQWALGILGPTAANTLNVLNSICYDYAGSNAGCIYLQTTSGSTYLYNNTMVSAPKGIAAAGTVIAKNNLIRSCATAASGTFAAGTDYNATDNASMGYTVTGSGNTHDRVGAFFTFTDESGDDFSLADADGGAKRYGVDLSGDANLPFSTDITGATRSGTWDIGAHQHVSSAATGTKFVRYIENLTAVTTTATALKSRVQLTLAAADQAASTDYLIIGYAEVANATAGAKVDLHLVNVTDSVTYQDLEPAPALSTNGDNIAQTMYGIYTSASTPAEKNFEIRFAAVSGTAQIKNAHITVIKLEAADKYDESTAKIDSTTSYADAASVTFTPASQGFYWIFGATEALHSAGHLPRAQLTVGGTQQTAIEEVDTPSSSARTSLALSWVEELAASSQTIALGVRDAGGSTDFYNTRVFALRLDGFPDYWYAEETTNDTTPATSFEAKASLTESFPAVRHLAIANIPARSSGTASINIITSLRDDSTVKREGITRPRQSFATEGTDSMSLAYSFTGSGSSKTIDAGWHFSGSASGNLPTASLLVLQLESSGITGAASGSIGTITGAATGTVDISGSASGSIGVISGTATGAVDIIGSASGSIGTITGTATGTTASDITGEASGSIGTITGTATATVEIAGSASGSIGAIAGSATGAVEVQGSASASIGAITGSAAATIDIAGSASGSIGTITGTAAGALAITGAASGSIGEITGTATASTDGGITGSAVGSIGAITGSATAAVGITGVAAASIGVIAGAASGAVAITGAASGSIGVITGVAAGTVLTPGALDLPAGTYAFRWTNGRRGFDWTHGERSFRHVDG